MTHGWPGSVIELLETVGPLTDPTAHGGAPRGRIPLGAAVLAWLWLLGRADRARLGVRRALSRAWTELMDRLGYTRYVAQGGDVSTPVTDAMGRQAPEGLLGIHINLLAGALGLKDDCRRSPSRNARRTARSTRSQRTASATSWSSPPGRRRSATPCWIHPSGWRPGCSTTTRTAITRSPARSSKASPWAVSPGQHRRQHHAVLADGHWRLCGPVVLGGRTGPGRSGCGRPGSSGGLGSGRLHDVLRRDLGCPA